MIGYVYALLKLSNHFVLLHSTSVCYLHAYYSTFVMDVYLVALDTLYLENDTSIPPLLLQRALLAYRKRQDPVSGGEFMCKSLFLVLC